MGNEGKEPQLLVLTWAAVDSTEGPLLGYGTIEDLAKYLMRGEFDDDAAPAHIYAGKPDGALQEVSAKTSQGEWDENDRALVTVQIQFPDGHIESAQYTRDGHA